MRSNLYLLTQAIAVQGSFLRTAGVLSNCSFGAAIQTGSQDHTMHSRISSLRGLVEGSIFFCLQEYCFISLWWCHKPSDANQIYTDYVHRRFYFRLRWGQRSAPGWQLQHDEAGDGWHRQTPSRWKHYLLESGNFLEVFDLFLFGEAHFTWWDHKSRNMLSKRKGILQ